MKKTFNLTLIILFVSLCSGNTATDDFNVIEDQPTQTYDELEIIEDDVLEEDVVEDEFMESSTSQSAENEYILNIDESLFTFNNFWPAVFGETLLPGDSSINENRIPKFEVSPNEGFSTVGVFDDDLRDDNGNGRCGHGKCIVDILEEFYPGVGVQAISYEDYLWDRDAYLYNLSALYRTDIFLNNEGFKTRGWTGAYLAMGSFFSQSNDGKAKIFTTSSSIGTGFSEEFLNADYVENEFGEINRDVWRYYDSLAGQRPFESSMYEFAQYLEANKDTFNGLVVGSVENTTFDINGDIVNCFDPNPDPQLYDYGWVPECGVMEDVVFLTGNFATNWLLVGWAGDYDVIGFPGKFYENHIVYVRGNPLDSSTSFSTPIVAALAANIVDSNPKLNAQEVKQIIINTADKENMSRATNYYEDTGETIFETVIVPIVNSESALRCAVSLDCLSK